MKLINKAQQHHHKLRVAHVVAQHKEMLTRLDEQTPTEIEVIENTEDKPLEVRPGVWAVPGDFYSETEGIVIAAADIGDKGAWEEA